MKDPSSERPLEGLVTIYGNESRKTLANYESKDNVSFSIFKGLTLQEYVKARSAYCSRYHKTPTSCKCVGLVNVARKITELGVVRLKEAYCCVAQHVQPCESCMLGMLDEAVRDTTLTETLPTMISDCKAFPSYKSSHAKRLLLQMPIAALTVVEWHGKSTYLCDVTANISMLKTLLERSVKPTSVNSLTKETFKELIGVCDSDKQRDCLKYAIGQAIGASAKQMRHQYGIENYNRKTKEVKSALDHVNDICKAIDQIANIKEEATLISLGLTRIENYDSDSSDGSESETEDDDLRLNATDEVSTEATQGVHSVKINQHVAREILEKSQYNWFALSEIVKADIADVDDNNVNAVLQDLLQEIKLLGLNETETRLITLSKEAYDEQNKANQDAIDIAEGIIVSSDDEYTEPVNWNDMNDPLCNEAKKLVVKKIRSIRRKKTRHVKKRIERERILKRRRSKNIGKILKTIQT